MKTKYILGLAAATCLASCSNDDWSFDDFGKTAVYFAQQNPIRTIVLGEDVTASTVNDNNHQFRLMCTMSGVYSNGSNRAIKYVIDESLVSPGMTFDYEGEGAGNAIKVLPSSYYSLQDASTLTIPSGEIMGGTTVTLKDEFFADPLSTSLNYVLPVKLVSTNDCDTILEDKSTQLLALRYKNKYHGVWLSRGKDILSVNGNSETIVRHEKYIENDELRNIGSISLNAASYPVSIKVNGNISTCVLKMSFGSDENCVISTDTPGCTASGTGKWEEKGAKKAWNNADRDLIVLDYTIQYPEGTLQASDTLVMRDRQSKFETYKIN